MSASIHLVIEAGPERGRSLSVPAGGARVGRSSKNDLVIVDPLMSRHHCWVGFRDHVLCISDFGSANATLVNDRPIRETLLHVGDRILLGDTILRVVTNTLEGAAGDVPAVAAKPSRTLARGVLFSVAVILAAMAVFVWLRKDDMPAAADKIMELLPPVPTGMPSDSATLQIDSVPQGATVMLNGITQGRTPCLLDRIPDGENDLEILHVGFQPYTRTIQLRSGQTEALTATLEAVPATLNIVSIPAGARIYLDDAFKGEAPLTCEALRPGAYRLRAEKRGYDPLTRPLTLARAQTHTEELRLVRHAGRLEVITHPSGVRVLIDGKERGVTAAPHAAAEVLVSTPLMIDLVEVGERTVHLVRDGFISKTLTVTVIPQKTLPIREKLKRRFSPDTEIKTVLGTYRGVLREEKIAGIVRLEINPGVIKSIDAADIVSRTSITPP